MQNELIHLIYTSAATDPGLDAESLEAILEASRQNNAAAGITGMLLYDSGAFFQVLEGEREVVERVYRAIGNDPRHERVTKLIAEAIEERSFGAWTMGYPRVTKEDLGQIEGLNDFFTAGKSFVELEQGRARTLLDAFRRGRWRTAA